MKSTWSMQGNLSGYRKFSYFINYKRGLLDSSKYAYVEVIVLVKSTKRGTLKLFPNQNHVVLLDLIPRRSGVNG